MIFFWNYEELTSEFEENVSDVSYILVLVMESWAMDYTDSITNIPTFSKGEHFLLSEMLIFFLTI